MQGSSLIINRQDVVAINLPSLQTYVRRLRAALCLRHSDFTVCFVDDREIQRLNTAYRHKPRPTDVLSFPWQSSKLHSGPVEAEFRKYLGDVVISAETARRHAREDGQVIQTEIRRLILHGLLHLLGYDHEADHGEMNSLESLMRAQLGV